ncbi:MAG: nucleotidyltransferase domain-containing protein [Candidatus Altiarchaeota archaeon]|nr:nucleotidyltransferase domain-containing protein [Candidatus Altiarchaeota archaeon]
MYKKINITENHLQVLALYTKGFNKDHYIREVQKLLEISPRTAQLILGDLEKKTVLESKTKGKIKTYKIKKTETAKDYLIFTEQYKKITFLKDKPMIRELLTKITPSINGIGIIFGSYAKGIEEKNSDLDIFIAGDYDKEETKKASSLYGIETSIKNYPKKIFQENMWNDILIKEVLDNHIVFSNTEEFIRTVLKNG